MTKKEAKEKGFTHIGFTYHFVKIYAKHVDSYEPEITGINWFNNILLEAITWLDLQIQFNDGFYMEVTEIK